MASGVEVSDSSSSSSSSSATAAAAAAIAEKFRLKESSAVAVFATIGLFDLGPTGTAEGGGGKARKSFLGGACAVDGDGEVLAADKCFLSGGGDGECGAIFWKLSPINEFNEVKKGHGET